MSNVVVFVFAVSMSFIPDGIESQPTIGDNVYEADVLEKFEEILLRLKQTEDKKYTRNLFEADILKSIEDALARLNQTERENEIRYKYMETARTSLERLERKLRTCSKQCPVSINLIKRLNQTSPSSGRISLHGVTKHDERIYVLYHQPKSILVFEDQNQFRLLNEIRLSRVSAANDIIYNDLAKCFYVTDYQQECIWKITIRNGNQAEESKWLTGTTLPYTISVSSDGRLLVLRGNSTFSQLEIYNGSDDRLISILRLPSDIEDPRHAIQAKIGGQILISHKLRNAQDETWVISRLTSDGQRIIARSNPRNNSERLSWPRHLALDPDNDLLFVADWRTRSVVVLHSESLDFRQTFTTKERNEIQYPFRLYYDQKKKQLITGQFSNDRDGDNGVVDVYEID